MKYRTKAGDTFEKVAYEQLGGSQYLPEILRANAEKMAKFEFTANEELVIPEITEKSAVAKLPVWFGR